VQRALIESLAEEVVSRLAKPRVGFLWSLGGFPKENIKSEFFTAVHYLPAADLLNASSCLKPCYLLYRIEDLKKEVSTLDVLVALKVSPEVLQGIGSGFPVSRSALFLSYFIDAGKPIIADLSEIRAKYQWEGKMSKMLEARLDELKKLGVTFIKDKPNIVPKGFSKSADREKKVVIRENGWVTWGEVGKVLFEGCQTLVLGGNTKLTLEAASRLRNKGIQVLREEE